MSDCCCCWLLDFAFRAVYAATWLVLGGIERARLRGTTSSTSAARLLAAISSIVGWFARLEELEVNAAGMKVQTLSGKQAQSMQRVFGEVIKPVSLALLTVPDERTACALGVMPVEGERPEFFLDLLAMIRREPSRSATSIKLERIEAQRLTLEGALKAHSAFRLE